MSTPKLSRRSLLKLAVPAIATPLLLSQSETWAREVEPEWIDVQQVQVTLPRLPPAFDGYRIAQLSDIHMDWSIPGAIMTRARLLEVLAEVNALKVDLVAITGDFVSGEAADAFRYEADLTAGLRELRAKDGGVAVLGNHDHWADAATIRRVIKESGLHDLDNAVRVIKRGNEQLNLAGVDDCWERKNDLPKVLESLPAEGASILLCHEPDFADEAAATGRFDLQMSGHTHGGQVTLPFFGPPMLPSMGMKYPSGYYKVGGMIQYTNRGIGMVPPYYRFNCRPEITVFTLHTS